MIFEVFAYWNIRELELVFNAVAAIVGSGDYLGLLRTLALVGMLAMAMAVLAGFSQLPDFGRWVIMLALFNAMLLVPKVNVVITDRTGTQPSVTVANVPIGLAAFAHSVSHIGDWLTRSFETTFSLPTDIQFRTNGTLFGHRVQQEVLHTKFDNSILTGNLMEFYRECVIPEYSTGFVVASDLAKSNDIWTYLSGKTNPGRLVTIRTIPGIPVPTVTDAYGCDVAYTYLTAQIVAVNTQQMNTLGRRLYPGLPTAAANAAVQGAIQTSTNYMLSISTTALNATKQAAMSNFMIDAQYMLPAQLGDAASASANLGQAQAIRSTSESYKMMAKMAESTMPKVKNIVEIVQYSVFPIILLLVLLAGHKGGLVLKAYVMSLVWVQLWPPLYAVMHLVMTMHAQDLAAMTGGLGLSISQYSLLNNAYISDEAIAGMIS
ncbi:MAG: conjugal transfer protein TraG N-terminal domain-containing protein, partial [Gallionella sp.]|nr:conjugal transfer protein TraG N-terminal domain-containing protein [Gallionella sp.]